MRTFHRAARLVLVALVGSLALSSLAVVPASAASADAYDFFVKNLTPFEFSVLASRSTLADWVVPPTAVAPASTMSFSVGQPKYADPFDLYRQFWSLTLRTSTTLGPAGDGGVTMRTTYYLGDQPTDYRCESDYPITCEVARAPGSSTVQIILRAADTISGPISSSASPALWRQAARSCVPGSFAVCNVRSDGIHSVAVGQTVVTLDRPVWSSLPPAEVGKPYQAAIGSSVAGSGFTTQVTGLPKGLQFDTGTGMISGTPTVAGQPYVYVKLLTPSGILATTATLSMVVTTTVPQIHPGQGLSGAKVGQEFSRSISATGPGDWTVTGLPPGLTWRPLSYNHRYLEVFGVPATAGTWTATVTLTSPGGVSTQTYRVEIH